MRNLLFLLSFALLAVSCNQNNNNVTPTPNTNNNNNNNNNNTPATFFKAKINGVQYQMNTTNIFVQKSNGVGDSVYYFSAAAPYDGGTYNMILGIMDADYAGAGTYTNVTHGLDISFQIIPMDITQSYFTPTGDPSTTMTVTSDNGTYVSGTFGGKVVGMANDTLNITDGSFTVKYLNQM